jgi:hypothetical protein
MLQVDCMYFIFVTKAFHYFTHTTQKIHANQNPCDGKASLYTILITHMSEVGFHMVVNT